jgi:hypothetical protein
LDSGSPAQSQSPIGPSLGLGLSGPKQIGLPLGLGLSGPKQIGLFLGLGLPGPRPDQTRKSAPLKSDSGLDSDSVRFLDISYVPPQPISSEGTGGRNFARPAAQQLRRRRSPLMGCWNSSGSIRIISRYPGLRLRAPAWLALGFNSTHQSDPFAASASVPVSLRPDVCF